MLPTPKIILNPAKKLVGMRLTMSFADNKTPELWRSFMPRRKEIGNVLNTDLYSVQLYSPSFFSAFNPVAAFDKWAAVEVADFSGVGDGMETLVIPPGLYAVFIYKGMPAAAESFFTAIFREWLPASAYELDDRPHFEILGDKYLNNDASSEEEVWIPIRKQ